MEMFLSFRIFEQLVLAQKTEFALKFFKTGGYAYARKVYAYACKLKALLKWALLLQVTRY